MNRKDIQGLRVHSGFPAFTLVIPCEKGRVKEALKDLLKQAEDSRWADIVAERCHELLDKLVCPTKPFKSAFFIDKHRAKAYVVPPEVPDCAICDTTFHLDPIIAVLNRINRYWIIDCTGPVPRLFEGVEGALIEPQSACIFVGDQEEYDLFDRCTGLYLEQDRLPICLVGPPQATQRFEFLAPYAHSIFAHVADYDDVWPAMQRWYASSAEKILNDIAHGRPDVDFLVNVNSIVDAARQGQISTLVLEEELARQGCEHPVTRSVVTESHCPPGFLSIDLIQEIIENVRSKGGNVFLLPAGSIAQHGRMVAFTAWR